MNILLNMQFTTRLLKKYVLYNMNVCSMNGNWVYYIHDVVIIM